MADRRRYSGEYRSSYDRGYAKIERQTYIDGNTARQLNAEPKRREEQRPERRTRRYPQKKPVHMPGIDRISFLFLAVVMALTIFVCFTYIQTQNTVHEEKNTIVRMKSEIATAKENNTVAYQEIIDSVDLSEVYKKATESLHMVQAGSDQIYTYECKKSDMVKQYGEIPDAK